MPWILVTNPIHCRRKNLRGLGRILFLCLCWAAYTLTPAGVPVSSSFTRAPRILKKPTITMLVVTLTLRLERLFYAVPGQFPSRRSVPLPVQCRVRDIFIAWFPIIAPWQKWSITCLNRGGSRHLTQQILHQAVEQRFAFLYGKACEQFVIVNNDKRWQLCGNYWYCSRMITDMSKPLFKTKWENL